MKKFFRIAGICLLIYILFLNPLWIPSQAVRAYILCVVPKCTSIEKAESKISYWTSWEISDIDQDNGYTVGTRDASGTYKETCIGEKSIRICLGERRFLLSTCILLADLGFDENGKLIDVTAYKEYDSL